MKKQAHLSKWIHCALLLVAAVALTGQASAQWVTYWDYIRGTGTSNQTATIPAVVANGTVTVSLTNIATGVTLPGVSVTMTNQSGGVQNGGTSSNNTFSATAAYATFNSYVDFSAGGIEVTTGSVALLINGLDPAKTYSFSGTSIRGNAPYTGRWTKCTLTNVVSFTSAHSAGVRTTTVGGTVLGANEAAYNSGINNTAGTGDVVVWTNVVPNASGQIVVISRIYNNTTDATDTKGYAISGFRLQEVGFSGADGSVALTSPLNNASVFAPPGTVSLSATASAAGGNTMTGVGFYATNNGSVIFLGSQAGVGPSYSTTSSALAVGTYGVYAIGTNSAAATFRSGTNVITVVPALASLTFLQQPSTALNGAVIAPEIQVGATNVASAAVVGLPVTLYLTSLGLGGGAVTANTDGAGIAHFANLTVTVAGTFTLTATNSGSGISTLSSSFSITNYPPINVGVNGSGTNNFSTLPNVAQWSTFNIEGPHNVARTDAELDTQMSTNLASIINRPLGSQAASGASGLGYWRSDANRIASQPTGFNGGSSAAVLLMATLNNASGSTIAQLDVNYVMACTVAPTEIAHKGHRVYYSTNGLSNSWSNHVGNITNVASVFTNNISFSLSNLNWAANSPLYIVWYDEDGPSPDGDYSIADISFRSNLAPQPTLAIIEVVTDPLGFDSTASIVINNTVPGKNYRVQYTDVMPPDWSDLSHNTLATGPTKRVDDQGFGTAPRRYYRVKVLDP